MDGEYIEITSDEIDVKTNAMAVYQQDRALVDMQIVTAKKYPRDLARCIENCVTLCTLDEDTAKSCNYTIVKGRAISGPSVVLAKIMAREFGNMRVENRVVGYDKTHVTCEATCFDLQKNYAIRTTIKKSLLTSSGSRVSEDMCVITGNAGNAIALRNAIFAVLPKQAIDKVYTAVREKMKGKLSAPNELIAARTKTIDYFKTTYQYMNLTDQEICMAVGRQTIEHLTAEDVIALRGLETSLRDGDMTVESAFRQSSPRPNPRDKSEERLETMIANAKTKIDLEKLKDKCTTPTTMQAYDKKMSAF